MVAKLQTKNCGWPVILKSCTDTNDPYRVKGKDFVGCLTKLWCATMSSVFGLDFRWTAIMFNKC